MYPVRNPKGFGKLALNVFLIATAICPRNNECNVFTMSARQKHKRINDKINKIIPTPVSDIPVSWNRNLQDLASVRFGLPQSIIKLKLSSSLVALFFAIFLIRYVSS